MERDDTFAVDFRERRKAAGVTQSQMAVESGYSRETISKMETREWPVSLRLAAAYARKFGLCVIEWRGQMFAVVPFDRIGPDADDERDDEEYHDFTPVEHAANIRTQAEDVLEATRRAERRLLFLSRCPESRRDLVHFYKELYELRWAVNGAISEGKKSHPEEEREGKRLAEESRPRPQRVDAA